jgi:acyl-CoA synthetase (AMP-forming)/AMP-acid ligase II
MVWPRNCVGLCFPPAGRGPLIDRIKRDSLASRGYAEPAGPEDTDAIEMVACGHPIEKNDVRIVDDAGHEVGERHEGMLEFRGPSMTKGYFRNDAKTRELFHDGWIKSGDRAYIAGGDIHITGRVKDIIIRAGRNTYPQEIEKASRDPRYPQGRCRGVRLARSAERHRAPHRDGGNEGDQSGGAREADRGRA